MKGKANLVSDCALAGLIISAIFSSSAQAVEASPGHLIVIGGGEVPSSIMERFVDLAGGAGKARIAVIPMASAEPAESGAAQVEAFKKLGVRDATALLIPRERSSDEGVLGELDRVTGVFFTGGDQSRLATNVVGTLAHRKLHELYQRGAVIGGTSAGAAIMSTVMITGDQRLHPEAQDGFATIEKGNAVTAVGLGLITNAIIDQHFIARKRQNRLFGLVLENPTLLGIGIDERTAIVARPDGVLEVIGEGQVMIFDARGIAPVKADLKGRLAARNVRAHLLTAGERFDLASPKN